MSGFPGAWYAAFFDGERKRWWWRLCRPGFRHVLAFGYSAQADAWLIYDVTLLRTYVCAIRPEVFDAWLQGLPTHRTIVRLDHPVDAPPASRLGFWCVPAVAHLLGVKTRALRPQALYRDLIAHGATPAFTGETA